MKSLRSPVTISGLGPGLLRVLILSWLGLCLAPIIPARAQSRPYIGFVYPAGGQQGTNFQVRIGGQGLDDVNAVLVSGSGVSATISEYCRRLNNQELQLLNEQVRILKRQTLSDSARDMLSDSESPDMMMAAAESTNHQQAVVVRGEQAKKLIDRIEKRTGEFVQTPACPSIASLVLIEVSVAADATPGEREIRLVTARGVSNPMVFYIGQLPEHSRKPMLTATQQVLGKEAQALRKRPPEEAEDRITLPCTVNGQIASGEMNRYRFAATKGQRLVIHTKARQLIPYIADAVPGWFQPVLALYDANGKEVAYDDDYRFRPDPTILFEVPSDGDYLLGVYDAIYRGREDFVYRITLGETPFVTSLFPLGMQTNTSPQLTVKGWNLGKAALNPPGQGVSPGTCWIALTNGPLLSNPLPFAVNTLAEIFEKEPNDLSARAQTVTLPVIINGRVNRPGDSDMFRFAGKSNEWVVAEVFARRLDSPLDSVLKLTDAKGRVLAFNDDCEDLGSGLNTHHADSYLKVRLPESGTYYVQVNDTARNGGDEYGYRFRLSPPEPDFELRVVPSSIGLRSKGSGTLSAYVIRKDDFTGPIKISLKNPPAGFSASTVSVSATQAVARINLKTDLASTKEPVDLSIIGTAKIDGREVTREAVPAEDRMQAFLWRHLVPARDLKVIVFDPAYQAPAKRVPKPHVPAEVQPKPEVAGSGSATNRPAFTKQQVAGRLRQLKSLFEEGLLTDDFYGEKVAELEVAQRP